MVNQIFTLFISDPDKKSGPVVIEIIAGKYFSLEITAGNVV